MLWIALYCPTLSLDRVERRFPAALIPAMAVTTRKGNRTYIQHANKLAQQWGIMAHQPLASALSLFPDLVMLEHDPDEEMKVLHEAAYVALRFTPNISLQYSGLIAEVSGSLKLFGGLKRLCQSLNRTVAAQGLQLCVGTAPTARGGYGFSLNPRRRKPSSMAQGLNSAHCSAFCLPACWNRPSLILRLFAA